MNLINTYKYKKKKLVLKITQLSINLPRRHLTKHLSHNYFN